MPSRLNELIVEEYAARLQGRAGVVLLGVEGLTVQEAQTVRDRVRASGARLQVTKNRLAQVAFERAGLPIPAAAMQGTCALLVGDVEATLQAAKAIEELFKKAPVRKIAYRAAWLDGELMTGEQAARIPAMPDRQTLRGMLCGAILGPARMLAAALHELPASSARALRARADQASAQ